MTPRISDVAVCCCRASLNSRMSRATFVASRAADELLGRAVFDVTRVLRAPALRRCAFAGSPTAAERRRIAAPRLRTRHRGDGQTSTPIVGRHTWVEWNRCLKWVNSDLQTMSASRPLTPQQRRESGHSGTSHFCQSATLSLALLQPKSWKATYVPPSIRSRFRYGALQSRWAW